MRTVKLTYKKSTKGTHVYANADEGFPGIYVPKEILPQPNKPCEFLWVTFSCSEQVAEDRP